MCARQHCAFMCKSCDNNSLSSHNAVKKLQKCYKNHLPFIQTHAASADVAPYWHWARTLKEGFRTSTRLWQLYRRITGSQFIGFCEEVNISCSPTWRCHRGHWVTGIVIVRHSKRCITHLKIVGHFASRRVEWIMKDFHYKLLTSTK